MTPGVKIPSNIRNVLLFHLLLSHPYNLRKGPVSFVSPVPMVSTKVNFYGGRHSYRIHPGIVGQDETPSPSERGGRRVRFPTPIGTWRIKVSRRSASYSLVPRRPNTVSVKGVTSGWLMVGSGLRSPDGPSGHEPFHLFVPLPELWNRFSTLGVSGYGSSWSVRCFASPSGLRWGIDLWSLWQRYSNSWFQIGGANGILHLIPPTLFSDRQVEIISKESVVVKIRF